MAYFWAQFNTHDNELFRWDTRIYLSDIETPRKDDLCIGAVVGKNPGSARGKVTDNGSLQPIHPAGDRLLPTVRNIVLKAYYRAGIEPPDRGYVQILNLLYLCSADLNNAVAKADKIEAGITCATEKDEFPWIWYVWGNQHSILDPFKKRYQSVLGGTHFFLEKHSKEVRVYRPSSSDFAKHTQGIRHADIVPFLSTIIN